MATHPPRTWPHPQCGRRGPGGHSLEEVGEDTDGQRRRGRKEANETERGEGQRGSKEKTGRERMKDRGRERGRQDQDEGVKVRRGDMDKW